MLASAALMHLLRQSRPDDRAGPGHSFNRPHVDIPNRNVDAAVFGRITSTNPQVFNRSLQFALKYVF